MVSNHQKYLCPDLSNNTNSPNMMDSSPLALLAQTCNSIGLPDPPANILKSSINASGKNSKNDLKNDFTKTSSKNESKSKTANGQPSSQADSTSDDRRSTSSAHSDQQRKAENASRNSINPSSSDTKRDLSPADAKSASTSVISSSAVSTSNKCGINGNLTAFPTNYPPLFPTYFPSTSTASVAGAFPFAPTSHLPVPPLPTGSCYPPFPTTGTWPLLPNFAPKCADPFCKTCPAVAAAAAVRASTGVGSCGTLGCPCGQFGGLNAHQDFSSLWLSYGSLFGMHGTPNPSGANPALLAAAASAYGASNSASGTSSTSNGHGQHVCSWMTGHEFCGKRFQTSEELLQHLRTHTIQEANKTVASTVTSLPPTPAISGRLSPRASSYLNTLSSFRFHPYQHTNGNGNKFSPTTSPSAAAAAAALASLQFPQAAFNSQAFCGSLTTQRLPGTLPHP